MIFLITKVVLLNLNHHIFSSRWEQDQKNWTFYICRLFTFLYFFTTFIFYFSKAIFQISSWSPQRMRVGLNEFAPFYISIFYIFVFLFFLNSIFLQSNLHNQQLITTADESGRSWLREEMDSLSAPVNQVRNRQIIFL